MSFADPLGKVSLVHLSWQIESSETFTLSFDAVTSETKDDSVDITDHPVGAVLKAASAADNPARMSQGIGDSKFCAVLGVGGDGGLEGGVDSLAVVGMNEFDQARVGECLFARGAQMGFALIRARQ